MKPEGTTQHDEPMEKQQKTVTRVKAQTLSRHSTKPSDRPKSRADIVRGLRVEKKKSKRTANHTTSA